VRRRLVSFLLRVLVDPFPLAKHLLQLRPQSSPPPSTVICFSREKTKELSTLNGENEPANQPGGPSEPLYTSACFQRVFWPRALFRRSLPTSGRTSFCGLSMAGLTAPARPDHVDVVVAKAED